MKIVSAGGHRLEYMWIGPGAAATDAPVLVFLHEGLGSAAMWKKFPDSVVRSTGCPALVYSRYGYGKSDPLTGPLATDYMHREALETLPEVLTELGISNPILIGHSDGASIALIHAGSGKWPVRALVLMAPHVFVENVTVQSIAEAKTAFEKTDMRRRLGRYHDDVETTFRGWNDIWLSPAFRSWNIEDYVSGVACPVLLIQGEDDEYGTLEQIRSIEGKVNGRIERVIFPRCGHSPQVDQAEATISEIAAFVGSLTRQAGVSRAPTLRS